MWVEQNHFSYVQIKKTKGKKQHASVEIIFTQQEEDFNEAR